MMTFGCSTLKVSFYYGCKSNGGQFPFLVNVVVELEIDVILKGYVKRDSWDIWELSNATNMVLSGNVVCQCPMANRAAETKFSISKIVIHCFKYQRQKQFYGHLWHDLNIIYHLSFCRDERALVSLWIIPYFALTFIPWSCPTHKRYGRT